jgi:hypothetical protein
MPIEIKELVIKTTVNEAPVVKTEEKETTQSNTTSQDLGQELLKIKRDIVNECMENFSHLLKQLNDR